MLIGPAGEADAPELAALLVEVVDGGASVGFLDGLTAEEAEVWWRAWLVRDDQVVLVARSGGGELLGTGTLVLTSMPNGRHRGEVAKLLVLPRARRRGVGGLLLEAVEQLARDRGRTLLVLDTVTDSPAQRLYEAGGWQVVGEIADYAAMPDGQLAPTTVMCKRLG